MRKEMFDLEFEISERGLVHLSQSDGGGRNTGIALTLDQIDIVIQWLQEAKKELNKDSKKL